MNKEQEIILKALERNWRRLGGLMTVKTSDLSSYGLKIRDDLTHERIQLIVAFKSITK